MRAIELVFAIASVNGATAACAEQGDVTSSEEILKWYALAADATRDAGGKVIKVIGDGVLLTFPPARVEDAVAALRTLQQHGS
jgi:class 3 adenylate cyclase